MNTERNNIGLDFGTTYTVISRLKDMIRSHDGRVTHYTPEACGPSEKITFIDSAVLKSRNGSLSFGASTRELMGRKGTVAYKGFKMMLTETDPAKLTARGYDEVHTPECITREFLDNILGATLKRYRDRGEHIDKLVVGVPEIWFSRSETNESRKKLTEILSSFDYIKEVELVSEPAAACAFFADKYQQQTKREFQGRMLLVDYGGGTLDIALCDVEPDEGQRCKVSVPCRAGEGFNEEGQIGKAGLAFMEEVIQLALAPSGLSRDEIIATQAFYKCINVLENQLMDPERMEEIEEIFDSEERGRWERLSDEFLGDDNAPLEFQGEEYPVTYGMLAKAYNTIIRPALDEKLDEIIRYMTAHSIDFSVTTKDTFKIYPVGGFCNFHLTKKQIQEKFHMGANDPRFPEASAQECESAIAFGAALIANNIVDFRPLAPYSLGASPTVNGSPFWFFRKGVEMPYGVPQFNPDILCGDRIKYLVYALENYENGQPILEYIDIEKTDYTQLLTFNDKASNYFKLGFSLDRAMVLTLHRHDLDIAKIYAGKDDCVIKRSSVELSDLFSIFGGLKEHSEGGQP